MVKLHLMKHLELGFYSKMVNQKGKARKKSFTIIEVLISVTLISVSIASVLQINQNNFSFLKHFTTNSKIQNDTNLAFFAINTKSDCKDEGFYLDDVIDFKNDEIRKDLKETKVTSKCDRLNDKIIDAENHQLTIISTKQNLSFNEANQKEFYRFSLGYK